MMIKRFTMATALFLAGSVASAHVPNIFVAGQPAKAQEINENFEHLLSEHSNYGVGGSTGGADGVDVGDPTGGTTDGGTTGGTTTGGAEPVGQGGSYSFAYVEGGVLKSADQPGDGKSPDESNKLVDANEIVLRFITEGSLGLPQNFVVFDYDTDSSQGRGQNSGYFGENVVIQFTAAADGSIDYSPFSVLENSGPTADGIQYYESTDCTGQGYLDANFLRVNGTVYKLDGEWVRLPLYDLSSEGITAKSKTNNAETITGSNPGSCLETNELVNQAVIPIAYDPEPIRLKLKAPVRVVEP
ncbi:hypothetical protein N9506_05695 [Pseudomonadales bacterium]|nr:hypothetical protein [Pseudomonadales bacterium]